MKNSINGGHLCDAADNRNDSKNTRNIIGSTTNQYKRHVAQRTSSHTGRDERNVLSVERIRFPTGCVFGTTRLRKIRSV